MPAPRLVSLKGSDFTGLGIEVYGGLKDGIFVKKVAPQGPASGHINIGNYTFLLIIAQDRSECFEAHLAKMKMLLFVLYLIIFLVHVKF